MEYGAAHTNGLYTYPAASGTQFTDGCNAIWNLGLRCLKVYCTVDYATNYPLQTAWSSTPTTLTELCQTTQFSAQLSRDWTSVVLTVFPFSTNVGGVSNWWRTGADNARLLLEYTELYNLTVHLLTTYNDSGTKFVLQNWEGDWAFADEFVADSFIQRKMVDYYAAFAANRQKAIADARRVTAHKNVSVQHAFECNRVLDWKTYPHRRRILKDIFNRVQPDIVSWSAYDGTIDGWKADQAAWLAWVRVEMPKALRLIGDAAPGVPIQIGEFGFPENEAPVTHDVSEMIEEVRNLSVEHGVERLIYWEVFDNEPSIPYTYRGYWLIKPDGTQSLAGVKFAEYAAGG